MEQYVMSYDFGTGSVKATLVDTDGKILSSATEPYPLYTPEPAQAEQDPEDYYRGFCAATRAVLNSTGVPPESVIGVAICSQWKGIIPIDKDGNVLHRSIIWLDARASKQAAEMNRILGLNYYKEKLSVGKPSARLNAALGKQLLCGSDYWAKLKWFRDELPDVYEKTAVILECNSFVKWRLTGEMAVDMTNHFTRSYQKSSQTTYDLMLKLARVDPALFPPIVLPTDRVGAVTEKAAADCGLAVGTPVFGGCGDIPAITVGSGCSESGDTHVYFGSSGWMGSVVDCKEGFIMTSPLTREQDLLCFGFQAIGLSFDWAVGELFAAEKAAHGEQVFPILDELLRDIPAGSEGLIATHWMYGERAPFFSDAARGAFVGLSGRHTRAHMLNAVMESVCYSMRLALDALRDGTRREVPCIHAVGGGCQNDRWMQMLSNVLGVPVRVPHDPRRAGAIGTAYCALIGLGLCDSYAEAKGRIHMEKTFTPEPAAVAAYQKPMAAYRKLYGQLAPVFEALQ